jgi:amino acid adenylation domain-containing protein
MEPNTDPLRFRLSPQQRRLWSLAGEDAAAVYRADATLAVEGDADLAALRRAVEALAERHEILRTTFSIPAGTTVPVQVVHPALPPAVETGSGTAAPGGPTTGDATHFRAAVETAPGGAAVHLSLPALCADPASLHLLAAELAAAYAAALGGGEEAEPPVQHADVSEVLNDSLESEEAQAGRDYWSACDLSGLAELRLPAPEAGAAAAFRPEAEAVPLPAAAAAGLDALAERHDTTAEALLLALWLAVLRNRTGREALVVAVAQDGRTYEGMETAVGPFARYVPVAARLAGARTLIDVAREVAAATAEQYEWAEFFAPGPDFPFGFDHEARPAPAAAGGVTVRVASLRWRGERFQARLSCVRDGGGVHASVEYDAAGVEAADARGLAARFGVLAERFLADPDAPLRALDPLTEADVRARVAAGTGPALDVAPATVHGRFAVQAARTPDRVAAAGEDRSLTFAELDLRANGLARRLVERGVRPDARVGLCLEREPELLVGILGILKAGAAFVPVDPAHPAERIAYLLEDSGASLVVTDPALGARLPVSADRLVHVGAADSTGEGAVAPPVDVDPDGLAYVIYTSGSTGRPKGVGVRHRAVVNLAEALRHDVYGADDRPLRVAMNAPVTFDASVKQWVQLLHGHAVHPVPESERPDPRRMLEWLRRSAVDVLDCTPTQLGTLLAAGLAEAPPPALRLLLVGGEPLDPAAWARLAALDGVRVFNVYGPTECTVDATAAPIEAGTVPAIGRPLANASVLVLDRDGRTAAAGVAGEICIGGAGLARGYVNAPGRTAERFVPHPAGAPGERLYRTGDLGRVLADGRLEFLGRADAQVSLRGIRVELGEIEAVLQEHPAVAAAAAAVKRGADGGPLLAAYWIAAPGAPADPAEARDALRAHLRGRLPEYMVPAALTAVERFPATANGKLDREALPEPDTGAAQARYEAPAGELEKTVAGVWQAILEVERVGRHDNFFDLGANSLLLVEAFDRLSAATEAPVTLVDMFRYPTVASLAAHMAGGAAEAEDRLDRSEERGRKQREAMQRAAAARSGV